MVCLLSVVIINGAPFPLHCVPVWDDQQCDHSALDEEEGFPGRGGSEGPLRMRDHCFPPGSRMVWPECVGWGDGTARQEE